MVKQPPMFASSRLIWGPYWGPHLNRVVQKWLISGICFHQWGALHRSKPLIATGRQRLYKPLGGFIAARLPAGNRRSLADTANCGRLRGHARSIQLERKPQPPAASRWSHRISTDLVTKNGVDTQRFAFGANFAF
jgi:hypothetical protein